MISLKRKLISSNTTTFTKKEPKVVSILWLITLIIAAMFASGGFVFYVTASPSPAETLYVEEGIYPRADYTIWAEETTWYVKDSYGHRPTWGISSNGSYLINYVFTNALTTGRTYKETVYLEGNMTLDASLILPDNVTLVIDGELTRASHGYHLILIRDVSHVDVLGGVIRSWAKAAEAYDTDEIEILRAIDVRISGVTIYNAAENGIRMWNCTNVKVTECNFYDNHRHAIDVYYVGHNIIIANNYVNGIGVYDGITAFTMGAHTITIEGNTVENVHGSAGSSSGIHFEENPSQMAGGYTSTHVNSLIASNTVYDCKYGITIWEANVLCIGNTIRKCDKCIYAHGGNGNADIIGNYIDNTDVATVSYGIHLFAGCNNIANNHIRMGGDNGYGIYWNKEGGFFDSTISNNRITTSRIAIYGVGARNTFINNRMDWTYREAIYCHDTATDISFIGCNFRKGSQNGQNVYADIYVDEGATELTFLNCKSHDDAWATYLVEFANVSSSSVIYMSGCMVESTVTLRNGDPSSSLFKFNWDGSSWVDL